MPEIAFVDSGQWGHPTHHLSLPPLLTAVQQACSVKIAAYGYAQATDASNSDLDTEQPKDAEQLKAEKERRTKRRQVEMDRFMKTADYFNLNDFRQWEKILNREPNISAFIIASQDGDTKKRLQLIRQSDIKYVLLMPPIATKLQDAQKIASQDGPPIITVWYPLRYARGILDAMEIINNGEFGLVSYALTFGTTSYSSYFWTRALPQYLDLLRVLFSEVEAFTLRAAGTPTRPSISMTTEHKAGIIGCVYLETNRFLQRYPHAQFMITGRRKLIVIDDAGLRRCSYYSTQNDSRGPSFSHDISPIEPSITLLNNWVASVKDTHKNPNPIPIADALNTFCLVTAIKDECYAIGDDGPIKADFQRRPDGTYEKL